MRRPIKYLTIILSLACILAGCKPTEQNYRAAYERTIEGRGDDLVDEETIYGKIRKELKQVDMVVGTDTIPIKTQYVAITDDGGGIKEYIKKYCVVAGQFKQVFTAKSMRERLVNEGYPGAFVVQTREPYYFVVAGSYNEPEPAIDLAHRLAADKSLQLKEPLPFILRPAQIR